MGRMNKNSKNFGKLQSNPQKRAPQSKFEPTDSEENFSDLLEDNEFDFDSIAPPSQSLSRQASMQGGPRLKGLESIYLQRLEANPSKKALGVSKQKKKKKGTKFRNLQDRFHDDPDYIASGLSENDDLAGLIEDNYQRMKKKFDPVSARMATGAAPHPKQKVHKPLINDEPNIFTGNRKQYGIGSGKGGPDFE